MCPSGPGQVVFCSTRERAQCTCARASAHTHAQHNLDLMKFIEASESVRAG